jgi:hypothetical protein
MTENVFRQLGILRRIGWQIAKVRGVGTSAATFAAFLFVKEPFIPNVAFCSAKRDAKFTSTCF